jgi:hypothetical protein
MAQLIPAFMDDQTPPGERDVFNMLVAGPGDWTALHSLDLAPWNRGLRTEIDFVVIIPDTGILCIEVKSHEDIAFDGHRWHPPTIKRSPFKQAADGRFSFFRRLKDLAPQFSSIPVTHCCVFPRAAFAIAPNMSLQPWELMDSRSFRSFRTGEHFCSDLKSRLQMGIEADPQLSRLSRKLSESEVAGIVAICIPVQKFRPDVRAQIKHRESQVENALREQQRPALKLAAQNERLIVSGGAGTGKSLLSIEIARRASESGRRVALLCFNKLVGDWMREQVAQASPALPMLVAGRAIQVMAEMTGVQIPTNPSSQFWEIELPQAIEERLTDPDFSAAALFDYIVVDEAQDILGRPRLWQCLAQFINGGVADGSFVLVGDFDHQALSQRESMLAALAGIKRVARPVQWMLTENCRNYRIVGDTAIALGGQGDAVYSGYLRTGGGSQNYDISFYNSDEDQEVQLAQLLRAFKGAGYRASEVTILSFRADEFSAAARLQRNGYKLRPAWQSGDTTAFASVQAYKGMENKIIILTDVVLSDTDFHRDLFYTGMTRATESVRVLCHNDSQDMLETWIIKGKRKA